MLYYLVLVFIKTQSQANLESLCKGTKTPEVPGECFHKVIIDHIKLDASDNWEWKNAITLCAGTNNADEKVRRFKSSRLD